MTQILPVIAPLFLIIFSSALLQRVQGMSKQWRTVLNDYALKIGLPALLFSSLYKADISFSKEAGLMAANALFLTACFVLAYAVGKAMNLKKELFRTVFLCLAFGNVAFLGIPVLQQVSGAAILPTASLIVAIYLIFKFTLGVGYLDYTLHGKRGDTVKNVALHLVKNPILIAVFLGLAASGLNIPIPTVLQRSLDMIVASVTPTVLVVIGLFIGRSELGRWQEWVPVGLFSVVLLMASPALFYMGVKFLGFAPAQFSSSIIQAAMPLAITPFALADAYNLDKTFIARSIVLSTIFSAFTLPFWISLF